VKRCFLWEDPERSDGTMRRLLKPNKKLKRVERERRQLGAPARPGKRNHQEKELRKGEGPLRRGAARENGERRDPQKKNKKGKRDFDKFLSTVLKADRSLSQNENTPRKRGMPGGEG